MRHTKLAQLLNPCANYFEVEHAFSLFSIITTFNLFSKEFGSLNGTNQTCEMKSFENLVNNRRPLNIFA